MSDRTYHLRLLMQATPLLFYFDSRACTSNDVFSVGPFAILFFTLEREYFAFSNQTRTLYNYFLIHPIDP